MMKRNMLIILALAVLVSGCVGQGGSIEFLKPAVTEKSADLLAVTDMTIIPTPPVSVDDTFAMSFQVKNQDDKEDVNNVGVSVFNMGACKLDVTSTDKFEFGTIRPQAAELVELKIKAPSNTEIGGLSATCPIGYKVNYSYKAVTQIDAKSITSERLTEKQRTGTYESFQPTENIGAGPLKIYLEYGAAMPIETGKVLPITLRVENKGEGDYGLIPQGGKLKLKLPTFTTKGYYFAEVTSATKGGCAGDLVHDKVEKVGNSEFDVYTNGLKDIKLIKGKSKTITCYFTVTPNDVVEEKSYLIIAELEYDYEVNEEEKVSIKPSIG